METSDPASLARSLGLELARLGTPERAAAQQRYLHSSLEFRGVSVPEVRRAVRGLPRATTREQLIALAEALWQPAIHESRLAAVMALERDAALMDERDLPRLQRFIREALTWALVDPLACNVLGTMVIAHAPVAGLIDAWVLDEDFWVRRSALLSQLRAVKGGAGLERFLGYADALLEEREFFIRKAIGWVLREVAKQRPEEVYAWLAPRRTRVSGVTMREALKHLTPEQCAALRS